MSDLDALRQRLVADQVLADLSDDRVWLNGFQHGVDAALAALEQVGCMTEAERLLNDPPTEDGDRAVYIIAPDTEGEGR